MDLTERGVAYWKVKTLIEFYKEDADDKFVKARFKMASKITDEAKVKDITALRNYWLPVMANQTVDGEEAAQQTQAQAAPVDTKGEF